MTKQHINSNGVEYEYQCPLTPEVYEELKILAELATSLRWPELDLAPYGKLGIGEESWEHFFIAARTGRGLRLRATDMLKGLVIRDGEPCPDTSGQS